jgi:hypothetical protein
MLKVNIVKLITKWTEVNKLRPFSIFLKDDSDLVYRGVQI